MGVEFRFTGFFESENWEKVTDKLKEEKARDKYPGLDLMIVKLKQSDRVVFSIQGYDCEYYWLEAIKIIKASSPVQYMSITYCDYDEYGVEVDAILSSNSYQGYMSFSDYWEVVEKIEYLDMSLLTFEKKLKEGSIELKPMVDSEEV